MTNPSDVDIMGEAMAFEKLKHHVDALEGGCKGDVLAVRKVVG